jgi:FixJ family two-component response regulator
MSPVPPSRHRDTVFVIDDDAAVRDSLSLLLSLQGYASATFSSAEDFLACVQPHWRGCVIADIRMPGMSGLDLQAKLAATGMRLPVIVVTAHGDVAAARTAFLAAAVDFIEKPCDPQQVIAAVEAAFLRAGEKGDLHERAQAVARARGKLSAREAEVMGLMVKGLHNRHIAEALGISPRTVEVHKARVMEKLGVRTLIEFVRLLEGIDGP